MSTKKKAEPSEYQKMLSMLDWHSSGEFWVLWPKPIPSLVDKPEEFERAVLNARIKLIHTEWDSARDGARELSDAGGVQNVLIVRYKKSFILNSDWVEGKKKAAI